MWCFVVGAGQVLAGLIVACVGSVARFVGGAVVVAVAVVVAADWRSRSASIGLGAMRCSANMGWVGLAGVLLIWRLVRVTTEASCFSRDASRGLLMEKSR